MAATASVVLKFTTFLCQPALQFAGIHGRNISVVLHHRNKNVGPLELSSQKAPPGLVSAPDWLISPHSHLARSPNGALVLSIFLKPNKFLAGDAAGRDLR
jgi:hypothetical protein